MNRLIKVVAVIAVLSSALLGFSQSVTNPICVHLGTNNVQLMSVDADIEYAKRLSQAGYLAAAIDKLIDIVKELNRQQKLK